MLKGKASIFGGPDDKFMKDDEGLALYENHEANNRLDLFYPRSYNQSIGTSKRLRPTALYFAYRFDITPPVDRKRLQNTQWLLLNPYNNHIACAWLVDWGPNLDTGRTFDVSQGVADALQIDTDQDIQGICSSELRTLFDS